MKFSEVCVLRLLNLSDTPSEKENNLLLLVLFVLFVVRLVNVLCTLPAGCWRNRDMSDNTRMKTDDSRAN